ncbi:hypothetical protein VTN02DRAFT_5481 [Thermoascus thermophilus]
MAEDDTPRSGAESSTEDDEPVETLIAGRAKRSTAGRNMHTLLDAEADDDLALLFAEDENDEEFETDAQEGEDVEDMRMDSSSEDDEDQGPNAQDDDLEGEKELEKQAKAERLAKKRKAQEGLTLSALRKKVKIDPTAVSTPSAPRPKKKSERISWLPTSEDGPTRSSSRRQTMQNKELTHARLKDSEAKRIRLIQTMEEAAKRKEKLKPREMTQAERLAEAEKVERINSKSLNRWEEMERKKAEEQRAKLIALQNRRLEGPVMSWWSGIAKWVNGKLTRVGNVEVQQKPEKVETERKRRGKEQTNQDNPKTDEKNEEEKVEKSETEQKPPEAPVANSSTGSAAPDPPPEKAAEPVKEEPPKEPASTSNQTNSAPPPPPPPALPQGPSGFLDGIHLYASLPENTPAPAALASEPARTSDPGAVPASVSEVEPTTTTLPTSNSASTPEEVRKDAPEGIAEGAATTEGKPETPSSKPPETQGAPEAPETASKAGPEASNPAAAAPERKPESSPQVAEMTVSQPQDVGSDLAPEAATPSASAPVATPASAPPNPTATPTQPGREPLQIHVDQQPTSLTDAAPSQEPAPPPVIEHTGRNLIVLENFDEKTAQSREHSIYFNTKKPPKLTKMTSHLCVITSLPARYRDPETGLPYANAYAYREIRRATEQKYTWSSMLGCYVGPMGFAARGVPERFLDPKAGKAKPGAAESGADTTEKEKEKEKENAEGETTAAATSTDGDPMEVDKA